MGCWFCWGSKKGEIARGCPIQGPARYCAIVWWTEQKAITRVFGPSRLAGGQVAALVAYLVSIAGVGAFMMSTPEVGLRFVVVSALTIALMHFWYDSFIWSVRRNEV